MTFAHSDPAAISRALDRVLPFVQKPARYTGGEYNSIKKDWDATPYRLALVFPDTYELGMSNLGLMILYDIVNKQADMLAERAYTPWVDMIAAMRREGIPLYSLENRRPLREFDVLGFTLPYEQLYSNVLTTLNLAGIPLRAADRGDDDPLILAGGSVCVNPEPVHAFFDVFFVGEGEEAIQEIVRTWTDARRAGLSRVAALRHLALVRGVYVPAFYEASYLPDGRLAAPAAPRPEFADVAPPTVMKRIVPVLPPPVTRFIVPFVDIVHNRAAIEIQRGCTRGCRFCQAGMIFRPVRERPLAEVLAAVEDMVRQTGFEEVSFLSLSSSDYSGIGDLVREVTARHGCEKLSIGLPSLRIESFSVDLMEALEKGRRRSGFTFAPEAATDRLRDVINKPISTQSLLDVAHEVYSRGWTTIKLYFMIGHPTQTAVDVQAIVDLARQVMRAGFQAIGRRAAVRIGVSTLVPKPHTPFQWVSLAPEDEIREHIGLLERGLRGPGFNFSWNNPRETLLEAVLSRGDRRLADVIEHAWRGGAGFDGWQDQFNDRAWTAAFADCGIDPDWYARRPRALDEVFPWDHISAGISKRFLSEEYEHSLMGAVVDDCQDRCYSCGILGQFKEERRQVADDAWGCPALGRDKVRQPVHAHPVPLYINPEMSPELAAQFGPRVPQRAGLVAQHAEAAAESETLSMSETYAQRVRITFATDDSVKYVGHLDMSRTFERAVRRARLPLAYTQGFNPQPRIQFAAALPVGFTGEAEVVDIFLNEVLPPEEVRVRLTEALPDGIRPLAATSVAREEPSLQSQLAAAHYRVEVETDDTDDAFVARLTGFLARPSAPRERRRGKDTAAYDLRPLVLDLHYTGSCPEGQSCETTMRSEASGTGRPDELLSELGFGDVPRRIVRLGLAFRLALPEA